MNEKKSFEQQVEDAVKSSALKSHLAEVIQKVVKEQARETIEDMIKSRVKKEFELIIASDQFKKAFNKHVEEEMWEYIRNAEIMELIPKKTWDKMLNHMIKSVLNPRVVQ